MERRKGRQWQKVGNAERRIEGLLQVMDRLGLIIIKQRLVCMFSFEDIYGYDTINNDKNYSPDNAYRYLPLFHHSGQEYSGELFYGKEELQDSLPTDARIQPPPPPPCSSREVRTCLGVESRSKEQVLYPEPAIQKVERCRKGGRFETNNIGKHLKSLTNRLLFVLEDAKILTPPQLVSVREFKERNGSKKDFQELLRHRGLREKFIEFCSTKNFVREILASPKMSFRSKLMMVKHLERLRVVGFDGSAGWKE